MPGKAKSAAGASRKSAAPVKLQNKQGQSKKPKGKGRAPNGSSNKKPRPDDLDMQIIRSDDEYDEYYSIPRQRSGKRVAEEEADEDSEDEDMESDVASEIASSSDDDSSRRVKTVSAANLTFLKGLDSDKTLKLSQKEVKEKAKETKRSQRKELEEEHKRLRAEKKRKLAEELKRFEREEDDFGSEFDEDTDDDGLMDTVPAAKAKRDLKEGDYQEYSDISEGEGVGESSSDDDDDSGDDEDDLRDRDVEEEEAPSVPDVSAKKAMKRKASSNDDQDAEVEYLARLGKRKAREQFEHEQERKKRVQAKLPVRRLDNDESELERDISDDGDEEEEGDDVVKDGDDEDGEAADAVASEKKSRAVHAPLPVAEPDRDPEEILKRRLQNQAAAIPHSSITHSTRFNLSAPYDILLISHPCRLPVVQSSGKPSAAYKAALRTAKTQTILLAKNQIASLASQIVADPEVNLGLLKRLLVFAGETISAPPEKIPEIRAEQQEYKSLPPGSSQAPPRPIKVGVDPQIRQLAIVSLLAIFVDILPGYRIRSLSEKEKEEKVTQEVARRREFESGLVSTYRDFLELCETEIKPALRRNRSNDHVQARGPPTTTPLQAVVIKVFTTLAVKATHFNYRQNILRIVVSRMSRRNWDKEEYACFESIQQIVREDLNGEVSLEVVRLIHRMTKERRYKVNSKVLDILLDLRLRNELGNKRSSTTTAVDPEEEARKRAQEYAERRAVMKAKEKGKAPPKQVRKGLGTHLSSKQKKKEKELKQIREEMKEAEATIDLEERERNQTETLKLVFVLYFTILKMPIGTENGGVALPVLESAMKGLSLYAHRVNVDFFRDLLEVLKLHVRVQAAKVESVTDSTSSVNTAKGADADDDDDEELDSDDAETDDQGAGTNVLLDQSTLTKTLRHVIIALKTTFDLFLGQIEGQILNLDLTDLLSHFYYILFYLPFVNESHLAHQQATAARGGQPRPQTNGSHATRKPTTTTTTTQTSLLDLAMDTLYSILVKSRQVFPATVLASFAKRLMIISLHLPVTSSSGPKKVLGIVSHLLTKPSSSSSSDSQLALLDLEDRSKNGSYEGLGKNLNTSKVLESGQVIAWELAHLGHCANQEVSDAADHVWSLAKERA